MIDAHEVIEGTVSDIERLRKGVAKGTSVQVSSAAEKDLVKANVQSWFRARRPALLVFTAEKSLEHIDATFRELLSATGRATSRTRYTGWLKTIKKQLGSLQVDKVIELSSAGVVAQATPDVAPSFAAISADPEMQTLLSNRWTECVGCINHSLPLAATVMLGGLLEAVLLARVNQLADKKPVFTAVSAPKDKKTGATLTLKDWGLSNYIDVANEVGWISDTYKEVGVILRDYRNYIHPLKEYQHKKTINTEDAKILWEIGKSILRQLL